MLTWVCTPNPYTRLLEIAVEYGLLERLQPHEFDLHIVDGRRVKKGK